MAVPVLDAVAVVVAVAKEAADETVGRLADQPLLRSKHIGRADFRPPFFLALCPAAALGWAFSWTASGFQFHRCLSQRGNREGEAPPEPCGAKS